MTHFQTLCQQIERDMRRCRVPGVAVGVLHGDEVHTAGFGVTHIDHPLPITPDTLFQIGSITKTFVGTAVMQLVEMGKIDLDAPVKGYVPELTLQDKDAEARATMRHLLTHVGGWVGDYFDDFGWGDDAIARYVAAMAQLPQVTPLGATFSYNNAGFNLAGRVIEKVTGQPFEGALRDLVFEPLGLRHTFFFPWDAMVHRFVVGHISPYDEAKPVTIGMPWPMGRSAHPVAGISSSVNELLTYARFHMGNGNGVLSQASLAQMKMPQVMSKITGDYRGLSWMLQKYGDTIVVGHGGATKGQMATFQMVPGSRFAIVLLTNSDRGEQVHAEAVTTALKLWLGVEKTKPGEIKLVPEALGEYCGRYTSPLADVEITMKGDGLLMDVTPKGGFPKPDSPPGPKAPARRLSFGTPDLAYTIDEPNKGDTFEFLRDAAGRIAYLRAGGRVRPKIT